MEDRNVGASAPEAGAAGGFAPANGGEASSGGTDLASAIAGEAGQHPKNKGKRRRKRKRGRKVFARDGVPAAGSPADREPQPTVAEAPPAAQAPAGRYGETRAPRAARPYDLPVFAALDLGTNNCRLLVAVPGHPGQFRVIDAFSRIVRLGEGLGASGRLSQAAMDRAVEALKVCGDKLRARKIENARLVATEACRAAANGEEFLARVESEAGLKLEIIDRQTEARLAVSGCGSLVERDTTGVVLFDIGGGSSEIALIDATGQRSPRLASHIVAWTSLPVGVVSLAEKFGGRDVSRETFSAMVSHVAALIEAFSGRDRLDHLMRGDGFHLLGTSGTVTTLAGVHLDLERYDRRRVDGLWMDKDSVDRMVEKLLGWDFQQRVSNACIGADRADLVLAGCAILEAIRAVWPSQRLRVADRGLREGILSELMGDAGVWRRGWRDGARR
ncbi:MAG: Ppx/GppA phosphatase family protein [Hyphomicrobiales bacterium]|nr:Ppx/GppA phosphatase family protein [Hyphomicrobiales bacterium]